MSTNGSTQLVISSPSGSGKKAHIDIDANNLSADDVGNRNLKEKEELTAKWWKKNYDKTRKI